MTLASYAHIYPRVIGSLFSGIGGLERGLELSLRARVAWQCEIDPFCRAVLEKHWPNVTRFVDVTRPRNYPHVDLLCGGFPCQDVSSAGLGRGIGGERSSLWWHFAHVIEQVAPAWVVVENVASGARRWLHHVRHQLHLLGYRTRALGIAASDVGAPHIRRRIFVIAYAASLAPGGLARSPRAATPPDPDRDQLREQPRRGRRAQGRGTAIARVDGKARRAPNAVRLAQDLEQEGRRYVRGSWNGGRDGGSPVPAIRRVDDGLSRRLDAARKRALGNAVVPACAEVAGEVIKAMIAEWTAHPISNVHDTKTLEK